MLSRWHSRTCTSITFTLLSIPASKTEHGTTCATDVVAAFGFLDWCKTSRAAIPFMTAEDFSKSFIVQVIRTCLSFLSMRCEGISTRYASLAATPSTLCKRNVFIFDLIQASVDMEIPR